MLLPSTRLCRLSAQGRVVGGQHVAILRPLGDNRKIGSCRGGGLELGPRAHRSRVLTTRLRLLIYGILTR